MKKIIATVLSLIILFSACIPVYAKKEKDSFRLVVPENWEMSIGDSRSVEAVFYGTVKARRLTWETEPTDVASVDEWGRVTALKEGVATVTAKTNAGESYTVELNVTATPTKIEKDNKEKHDYNGEAAKEGTALQKIVTRYAKGSGEVPEYVSAITDYKDYQAVYTNDGAKWEITDYGVLRTNEKEASDRDVEQRFMGDRYFYEADTGDGKVLGICADDKGTGIWTIMGTGYTHIELTDMSGTEKAVLMSDNTQEYVERRGMVSDARYDGTTGSWIANETDNDGLWTAMYGVGELMRYAVLRDDPNATAEEIEAARQTATLSTEAVLFLTYVSMRQGTTESYYRAQRNGNVSELDLGKYYTSEALIEGGDYSQNIPGESPATMFEKMNNSYMLYGKRSYIMKDSNLMLYSPESFVNPAEDSTQTYAKRTRQLEGFWARTYSLKEEGNDISGNIYWEHLGDGTALGVSTRRPDQSEYLLHGENLRGTITDASGEMPQRLWDDLIGSGYDLTDVIYKGDTSADEIIGHLFIYKLAYDILGDEDPELKELIVNTMRKFAQHLVDNGYALCEATGQPTTWGKLGRTYFHNGQNLGGGPLHAAVLLSAFKLTAYVTGEQKWEDEYRMAALDPAYEYAKVMTQAWERYKMAILEYAAGASKAIPLLLRPFMETETIKAVYRMILNYSDEEMACLAYYLLFQMEDDEALLTYYREGLEDWWYSMSLSENPLLYYMYQLAYPNEEKTDYYGNSLIETASWSLSRHPIDTVKYLATNNNRDDIRELDLEDDCGIGGTRVLSYDPNVRVPLFSNSNSDIVKVLGIVLTASRLEWKVAAPDERSLHKFNSSTYKLEDDHNPWYMEGSTTYTLPYWFGRYHGMLSE